jgi:hypothetical protein
MILIDLYVLLDVKANLVGVERLRAVNVGDRLDLCADGARRIRYIRRRCAERDLNACLYLCLLTADRRVQLRAPALCSTTFLRCPYVADESRFVGHVRYSEGQDTHE